MTEPLLAATQLCKSFGGLPAVNHVSLSVAPGSITGLIGPNGAGKTTLFNLLAGSLRPDSGQVIFQNQVITGLPQHRIAQRGLVRTFQVARVFSRLSVLDNVLLAAPGQLGEQVWPLWVQPQRVAQQERQLRTTAMEILESVGLAAKAQDYAGALSGGQRKLLEMARGLMTRPKLMLLDEPAAGVNPTLVNQMCEYIQTWNKTGLTFLIIEHNMDVIMSLCQQVWVLAEGKNLAVGTPGEIQTNPTVLAAYLGSGEE
ncbi:MAG: ABC transporter ATP-binding protein [Gloeomargarita sp. HHBFW_bins_162]